MSLRVCLSLALLALSSGISAQLDSSVDNERGEYALLWEISGNNLNAPSYLFGSMHVRYKSVFEFPDSLLIYLNACDALANEIHLDSAMQRIFEVYLSNEELDVDSSYIAFIQEKVLPTDELGTADEGSDMNFRTFLKHKGEGLDLRNSGTMPTMLDAHLMETARRLGKELYGLEDIDEHLYDAPNADGFSDQFKFSWLGPNADDLLRLYYAGALEPINEFIETDPAAFNQLALTARNYIMVESMERIMSKKRLFSVVGAAHLPGDEGVIELLRKKGYTLRKVAPNFTGLRDSFLVPEIERPWPEELVQNELFSFAMPLGSQHVYHESANTSYLCFDIGRGVSYLLLCASMLPYDYQDFDDVFFVEDGYEIVEKTPYQYGDLEGYEYDLLKPGHEIPYYRAYTFTKDQQLYYFQIGAYEEATLSEQKDVAAFLTHFELLKTNKSKWVRVKDTLGGFSVNLPDNYFYSASSLNEEFPYDKQLDYPLHQYRAGFDDVKASVWLQYYDIAPGARRENEWAHLEEGLSFLEDTYGLELQVTDRATFQGYASWMLKGEFPEDGLVFSGRIIARANRVYLLSQVDEARTTRVKKFLPSFKLLPLDVSKNWVLHEVFNSHLKIALPTEPAERTIDFRSDFSKSANEICRLRGLDEAGSATYEVEVFAMPLYYSVTDSALFFQQKLDKLLADGDSLMTRQDINLEDGTNTHYFRYTSSHEQLQQAIQLYHKGRYWVRKRIIASDEYLSNPAISAFFKADEWTLEGDSPTLFESQSTALIAQLRSPDSLQILKGLKSIDTDLSFTVDDLDALRTSMRDNHWTKYNLNTAVVNKLMNVFLRFDDQGLEYVASIYENPLVGEALKEAILLELAAGDEPLRRELIFRVLEQEKEIPDELTTKALASFDQNPELTINYWSDFARLLDNAREPLYIWELARQALAQDSFSKAPILATRHLLVSRGKERLLSWQKEVDRKTPAAVFGLYHLLPDMPDLIAQARNVFDRPELDLASVEAAGYLLSKGEVLPNRRIKQLLKAERLRIPMLRLLNKYNLLDQVGGKHYEPEAIARYLLLEELTPHGKVSNIEYHDTTEALFRGEPQRAFVYSFDLDGDKSRLAVVGFFAKDEKERKFLDGNFINYTLYTITSRRRERKAQQLIEEMQDW